MSEHTDATEDRDDDESGAVAEESDAEQPQPLAKTSSGSTELENT